MPGLGPAQTGDKSAGPTDLAIRWTMRQREGCAFASPHEANRIGYIV